ncbi:MAG: NmrA/HSCARG family protein [Saprospiraceae bacterium]|uniref:NmrA/HSCARG family protein n=1 Tax=Candidatus Opimibacter skivensis TaxID=2982028 RepID=A0A9D7SR75_9BACT|nr:NmrA/HSCARG family protein [Candidatus Opimibacter skivensis]
MTQKKIIAVFGATGAQGGGLAKAILQDPNSEFAVRVITRNTESDKAQELAAMGAEVVSADVDDKASMVRALQGAYGAFFVTFFWSHFSPETEGKHAKDMADAAKEASIKHAIWSTLEDTRRWVPLDDNRMPTLQGKYKVPHFDGKGESDHYFTDAGVPTTFMLASYYWDNLIHFGMGPKKGPDGTLAITFPMGDKKMAGIGSDDIGKCAYGIFKKGPQMIGKTIGIAGEQLSLQDMAAALSKALGQEVKYNEVTPEMYRSFGFPGADDLGNMFQFYRDFDEVCNRTRDVNFSRELNPELKSFDMWLAQNANRIPLE